MARRGQADIDLPLEGPDSIALGLDDVVEGLEGAANHVLNVPPLVHTLIPKTPPRPHQTRSASQESQTAGGPWHWARVNCDELVCSSPGGDRRPPCWQRSGSASARTPLPRQLSTCRSSQRPLPIPGSRPCGKGWRDALESHPGTRPANGPWSRPALPGDPGPPQIKSIAVADP